jgi:hypothetical protein
MRSLGGQAGHRAVTVVKGFFIVAMCFSAGLIVLTVNVLPSEGGFEGPVHRLVAENQLLAVEGMWVGDVYVTENSGDGASRIAVGRLVETDDYTVRWLIQSYFILLAENREYEKYEYVRYELEPLERKIASKFDWVRPQDSHYAWELVYNETAIGFGSDILAEPEEIPEDSWEVIHDYSGKVSWYKDGTIRFRAELRFVYWLA